VSEFVPPSRGETPQVSEPVGPAELNEPTVAGDTPPSPNGGAPSGPEAPLAEAEQPPPPAEPHRRQLHPLIELVLILACAFGLWYVVNGWVVKPYRIPSASMEPTLMIGDRVLVSRFIYRFHPPHRFDIVVFHPPACRGTNGDVCLSSQLSQRTGPAGVTYIKRVIGLPGETVIVRRNGVTVCEHASANCHVLDESFLPAGTQEGVVGTYHVPQGDYFMMGDNRGDSQDSRSWGPEPGKYIIGEAFATYWPLNRIRTL
jgi:signal peptidase I